MPKALTTNAADIAKKMARRAQAVERELKAAARSEIAPVIAAENKKTIQAEIYDVPIPLTGRANRRLAPKATVRTKTTKGKHGKWQRTGTLKRSETATADGADVLMRNNAKHGKARYALGGPPEINKAGRKAGVQRSQPDVPEAEKSKTRSVQWHALTAEAKRGWVVIVRRQAVLRALTSP